jgi:SAM-dependent methyltransferase
VTDTSRRLSDRNYWEGVNSKLRNSEIPETVANHVFWDLLPRYVQKPHGATVVEIGSAPGSNLVGFYRRFGYSPFGIEYTSSGVATNQEVFRQHGLDPEAVIHADLFDEDRLRDYRERFDVVYSRGLIEHFEDPNAAVRRHVDLLAHSGILIITIPNLQGLNWLLCKISCPDLLAIHNLSIMNSARWLALFEGMGLTQLYSGYCGVIDLGLVDGGPRSSKLGDRFLQTLRVANYFLRSPAEFLRVETRLVSPHLIYIGKKL